MGHTKKGCSYYLVHTCERTCSDCRASPPCVSSVIRLPCVLCNRHFRSQACFDNHENKRRGKNKKNTACELRKCGTCCALITLKSTNVRNGSLSSVMRKNSCHLLFLSTLMKKPISNEHLLYYSMIFRLPRIRNGLISQLCISLISRVYNSSVPNARL